MATADEKTWILTLFTVFDRLCVGVTQLKMYALATVCNLLLYTLLHPLHSRSLDMPLDLRWVPRSGPVLPSATLPDSFCSRVFPCSFLVCVHCCNCTFLPFGLRPARASLLLLLCWGVLSGSPASEIRIGTLLLLITGCKFFKGRLCEWITKRTITDWCCVLSLFLSDFSFSTHQDCLHFWDNHTNSIFWSHCHTRYIPHAAQCSFVLS